MQSFKRQYTHFLSLPFIREDHRAKINNLQERVNSTLLKKYHKKQIMESKSKLAHLSLCMLSLENRKLQRKAQEMLHSLKQQMQSTLDKTILTFSKLGYFSRYNYESKKEQVSVIYLAIDDNDQFNRVLKATDKLIRGLLKEEIITQSQFRKLRIKYSNRDKLYYCQNYHLTLFRLKDIDNNQDFKKVFSQMCQLPRPLRFGCDFVDISTRFLYESSGFYRPLKRVVLQSEQ